jgi:hypothetical protein
MLLHPPAVIARKQFFMGNENVQFVIVQLQ